MFLNFIMCYLFTCRMLILPANCFKIITSLYLKSDDNDISSMMLIIYILMNNGKLT